MSLQNKRMVDGMVINARDLVRDFPKAAEISVDNWRKKLQDFVIRCDNIAEQVNQLKIWKSNGSEEKVYQYNYWDAVHFGDLVKNILLLEKMDLSIKKFRDNTKQIIKEMKKQKNYYHPDQFTILKWFTKEIKDIGSLDLKIVSAILNKLINMRLKIEMGANGYTVHYSPQ